MPTKIEWATETWNPITGCTPISEGCANCYAARMAKRLAGRFGYPADEPFRPGVIHKTGPGARECKREWIADLYEQCKVAGVPFFDKKDVLGQGIQEWPE